MNLNFTITELCKSDKAQKNNISNIPQLTSIYDNMLNLIVYLLQPVRDKFGYIQVTSGYRCEQSNKLVKGVYNSNHLYGCAVDIIPKKATFKQVYDYVINNLDYDECFIERNSVGTKWLHLAYRHNNNRKKHNSEYLV